MYMSKEYNWEVPLPFCPWFTQCSRRVGTQSLERHERETRGVGINWKPGSVVGCALIGRGVRLSPSLVGVPGQWPASFDGGAGHGSSLRRHGG